MLNGVLGQVRSSEPLNELLFNEGLNVSLHKEGKVLAYPAFIPGVFFCS